MARDVTRLDYGTVLDGEGKAKIDNVSAAASGAGHLWTVSDEGFSFERLKAAGGDFGNAASFALADYFDGYPRNNDNESDLEGMALDSHRLWLAGSHALVRKKYDKRRTDKLLDGKGIEREDERCFLGFVEIDDQGQPVAGSGRALPIGESLGGLVWAMRQEWRELSLATERPAKENGLDIEGLAVTRNRIFLGLRGPVLGPYAIVLEMETKVSNGALAIVEVDGHLCRPHLIDTGGLGIRDLAMHPKGLLVLAGPTLDMEGPFELYLSRAPLDGWSTEPGTSREARFLMDLPIERQRDAKGRLRGDRPEAIAIVGDRLLVIPERKLPATRPPRVLEALFVDLPAI